MLNFVSDLLFINQSLRVRIATLFRGFSIIRSDNIRLRRLLRASCQENVRLNSLMFNMEF